MSLEPVAIRSRSRKSNNGQTHLTSVPLSCEAAPSGRVDDPTVMQVTILPLVQDYHCLHFGRTGRDAADRANNRTTELALSISSEFVWSGIADSSILDRLPKCYASMYRCVKMTAGLSRLSYVQAIMSKK